VSFGKPTVESVAADREWRRKAALKYQETQQRKPLRAESPKRARENRQRTKMRREAFGYAPMCAVPGCCNRADDLHEVLSRARGGSITDPENCVPLCSPHHGDITDTEPQWAYDMGLLRHSWDETSEREEVGDDEGLYLLSPSSSTCRALSSSVVPAVDATGHSSLGLIPEDVAS
jgi:hypothetical protein